MTAKPRATLISEIAAAIVAGAPGSITEAEVAGILTDLVDSTLSNIKDASILAEGAANGTILELRHQGATGTGVKLVAVNDDSDHITFHRAIGVGESAWVNSLGAFHTKANIVASGNGEGSPISSAMISAVADVIAGLDIKPAGVPGGYSAHFAKLGTNTVGAKIMGNGEILITSPSLGVIKRSPTGHYIREYVNDDGTRAFEILGTMGSTGSPSSTPASVTTLLAALVGEGMTTTAIFDRRGYVAATDAFLTSWAEVRGTAIATFTPAVTTPAGLARPYWNGTTERFTMAGMHQMATAAIAGFAAGTVRTLVIIGAVEVSDDVPIIRIDDASGGWAGISMLSGTIRGDFFGTNFGFVRPNSGVAGSKTRRVIIATRSASDIGIEVPNTARVALTPVPMPVYTGGTGALQIGASGAHPIGSIDAILVSPDVANAAAVTLIRDFGINEHGAVAA